MVECDYCEDSFGDEDAYLDHLASEHEGELGAIDQRRVASHTGGDSGEFPLGPVLLVGLLLFSGAIVVWVTFMMGGGGGSAGEPGVVDAGPGPAIDVERMPSPASNSLDYHGTINVTIAGERVDFSQSRYQRNDGRFHFENGDGRIWHGHAQGITLEYAMATVGIDVNESAVTFRGTTYRDSDAGTDVTVEVDGQSVNPQSYVLEGTGLANANEGDRIRIVVRTSGTG